MSATNTAISSTIGGATSTSDFVDYFKEVHSIHLTPAGLWEMHEGKKSALDAMRVNGLAWEDFPDDNMGKVMLPNGILVLDIDESVTRVVGDTIEIPDLGITLPLGLYTQTSREGAYHIYYKISHRQQQNIGYKMIKGLADKKIDILQNFLCFEGHSFSPHNKLYEGDILDLPIELETVIGNYIMEKGLTTVLTQPQLNLSSNYPRAVAIKQLLDGKLESKKDNRNFLKRVFPDEYYPRTPTGRKKSAVEWEDFDFGYDFLNKTAVKLACTKELSFYDHVVPALKLITARFGKNADSKIGQKNLRMILPSLPQHEVIRPFDTANDLKTLEQFVEEQDGDSAIFRLIKDGKKQFINIDRRTLLPVEHNDGFFFDASVAEMLHPERITRNDEGKRLGWDEENIPIIGYIKDPYSKPTFIDEYERVVVNLVPQSPFVANAEAIPITDYSNFIMNVVCSTVHPDYQELVLHYYAQVVFGTVQPSMILWLATGSELGGTGKSMISITILGKILKQQAATVQLKLLGGGYDMTEGVRILSAEEGNDSNSNSNNDWDSAYNTMKQLLSGVYAKTNGKYERTNSKVIKVAISGSSNSRPRLPSSDRRMLCLEPAHLGVNPATDPVSKKDVMKLNEFERDTGGKYDDDIQVFTNHLLYLREKGMSPEIHGYIFNKAPDTPWRRDWVTGSTSYTSSIALNIGHPRDLMDTMFPSRIERMREQLIVALQYIVYMYEEDKDKLFLSYQVFNTLIPLIAREDHEDTEQKPQSIARALRLSKFTTPSPWAIKKHKASTVPGTNRWPQQMHAFTATPEAIEEYKVIIQEQQKLTLPHLDDGIDL